jgi:prepilin-type N-terminal cleavage/methylation domain-containing protein
MSWVNDVGLDRMRFLSLPSVGTSLASSIPQKTIVSPPANKHRKPAFSLIEMVAVIAVLAILMLAGVSLMNGSGPQARKAGADLLAGMIEQARSSAITTRGNVLLAIAEPGDLPAGDERCRLGLFQIKEEDWKDEETEAFKGTLLSRWKTLETGVILLGGKVDGMENPLDGPKRTISYGSDSKPQTVKVRVIGFNSRGGLRLPAGSAPIVMRIAEGNYRNGGATPFKRAGSHAITENRLKISRVTARPYRIDG